MPCRIFRDGTSTWISLSSIAYGEGKRFLRKPPIIADAARTSIGRQGGSTQVRNEKIHWVVKPCQDVRLARAQWLARAQCRGKSENSCQNLVMHTKEVEYRPRRHRFAGIIADTGRAACGFVARSKWRCNHPCLDYNRGVLGSHSSGRNDSQVMTEAYEPCRHLY